MKFLVVFACFVIACAATLPSLSERLGSGQHIEFPKRMSLMEDKIMKKVTSFQHRQPQIPTIPTQRPLIHNPKMTTSQSKTPSTQPKVLAYSALGALFAKWVRSIPK